MRRRGLDAGLENASIPTTQNLHRTSNTIMRRLRDCPSQQMFSRMWWFRSCILSHREAVRRFTRHHSPTSAMTALYQFLFIVTAPKKGIPKNNTHWMLWVAKCQSQNPGTGGFKSAKDRNKSLTVCCTWISAGHTPLLTLSGRISTHFF